MLKEELYHFYPKWILWNTQCTKSIYTLLDCIHVCSTNECTAFKIWTTFMFPSSERMSLWNGFHSCLFVIRNIYYGEIQYDLDNLLCAIFVFASQIGLIMYIMKGIHVCFRDRLVTMYSIWRPICVSCFEIGHSTNTQYCMQPP